MPVSCLAFSDPGVDDRELWLGDEFGGAHAARCGGGASGKTIAKPFGASHGGFVASIAAHPAGSAHAARAADALGLRRGLCATAALDWTARVWAAGAPLGAPLDHGAHAYVAAVAWSPSRAALLATCTAAGRVHVWTVAGIRGPEAVAPPTAVAEAPCTSLAFAADGRRLAVGDARGRCSVLALSSVYVPARHQ